jgi:hypothetical protein
VYGIAGLKIGVSDYSLFTIFQKIGLMRYRINCEGVVIEQDSRRAYSSAEQHSGAPLKP